MIRYTATGDFTKPAELGRSVARVLLERGAREILDAVYATSVERSPAPQDGLEDPL
jgi:hypothetical protein